MSSKIKTIGELKDLIASLPNDTKIVLFGKTDKHNIYYDWNVRLSIQTLLNQDECCEVCDKNLSEPKANNNSDCKEHSGSYVVIHM